MYDRAYLLKIRLLEINPEIWRRFVVPASITLDRLHDVIQIVIGWTDSHLHEFTIGTKTYSEYLEDLDRERGILEDNRYRLYDLIKRKGRTFSYLYDFGDYWQHELVLEDSHYPKMCLSCFEGERACPPEDVGGIGGYYEFCDVLLDPTHEEHERYKIWSGGDYRIEAFDVSAVNWELGKYIRWSRNRYHPCYFEDLDFIYPSDGFT